MIHVYTQIEQGQKWVTKYRGTSPVFACVLGFTETCLIPGISAAGSTPEDRKYTACADAEFLYYGAEHKPRYSLPALVAGTTPVLISRTVVEALQIPVYVFNAGLPQSPAIPTIDLDGCVARCLSQGKAMELATVKHLFKQGLLWGEQLSNNIEKGYLILSECVVGGTTTALAILTGLDINAQNKVNSSHAVCNHEQKWAIVQAGLQAMRDNPTYSKVDPIQLVAAVGDPMQIVVAGMACAASRSCGVLLAGGTQMLAVYALTSAIADACALHWCPHEVVVGTTRWVVEDPTGATVELAELVPDKPSLLATELSFEKSRYAQLQAYEQGFVKEGVGAGGACIAANLTGDWQQNDLLEAIEAQLRRLYRF